MTTPTDREIDRHTKLIELLLQQSATYHNHKENMAHAGLLVLLGFVGALTSVTNWPPSWIQPSTCVTAKTVSALGFVAVWLLIHLFIRWQLRNRRSAALIVAALSKTLRNWAMTPPDTDALKPYEPAEPVKPFFLLTILDYFLPLPCVPSYADVDISGYQKALVEQWNAQEKTGTGAIKSEWLLWIGSIALLAIGLLRTMA